MEAEPNEADLPKRRRRWFQFSLRSLLIGITLLAVACSYVGWQANIVRERRAAMISLLRSHPVFDKLNWATVSCEACHINAGNAEEVRLPYNDEIPWIRRLLGDKPYRAFIMPRRLSPADAERIRELFPEASIYWPNEASSLAPAARAGG